MSPFVVFCSFLFCFVVVVVAKRCRFSETNKQNFAMSYSIAIDLKQNEVKSARVESTHKGVN